MALKRIRKHSWYWDGESKVYICARCSLLAGIEDSSTAFEGECTGHRYREPQHHSDGEGSPFSGQAKYISDKYWERYEEEHGE
jgi:hypothetical protein